MYVIRGGAPALLYVVQDHVACGKVLCCPHQPFAHLHICLLCGCHSANSEATRSSFRSISKIPVSSGNGYGFDDCRWTDFLLDTALRL